MVSAVDSLRSEAIRVTFVRSCSFAFLIQAVGVMLKGKIILMAKEST